MTEELKISELPPLSPVPSGELPVSQMHGTARVTCKATVQELVQSVAPRAHSHTPADIGLSNVDNTSDASKPVSTAQQAALDGKAATSHTHSYTKTDVGLSNVDNTSDANKPVSIAQQAALDAKEPIVQAYTTVTGGVLNCAAGQRFKLSMSGNVTLSISNPPAAGSGYTGLIEVAYTSGALTLPAGSTKAGTINLVAGNTYLLFFNRSQASVWQFVMTQGIA